MTQIETALIAAAKAFISAYVAQPAGNGAKPAAPAPTPTSNGIPVCQAHGKAMKPGSEKQKKAGYTGPLGYKCTAKNVDGSWCDQIA